MTRVEALELLHEHTHSVNLRAHAYGVEAAMRAYAERFGEDPERWGIVGLLHDFDYERHPSPEEHPMMGARILAERGLPEDMIEAIKAHADYLNIPRTTPMAKALYACDELVGLLVAVALVRPSKKIGDVTVKSVNKKWKDKAFARGVNREDIERGTEALGVPLDEHIGVVLEALKGVADELGL
jgi:putative nucleotidyltransferase with HDIG domain